MIHNTNQSQSRQKRWYRENLQAAEWVERTAGLFEPCGQYARTDTDDKMKGGAGADGKSKKADEQKEAIQSDDQAHIASRDNTLLGMPTSAETVCHDPRIE
jgi:hypothetical protein